MVKIEWLQNNWEAILSLLISTFSIWYAYKANNKSDEANELSKKSIAINYDATFNDFNIQLRENIVEIIKTKERFKRIKSQTREYMHYNANWIPEDLTDLQTQKEYMRPSEYYSHYVELEGLIENIKSKYDILEKIEETSKKENNPFENEIFVNNYEEIIELFDLIIKKLEERVNYKELHKTTEK